MKVFVALTEAAGSRSSASFQDQCEGVADAFRAVNVDATVHSVEAADLYGVMRSGVASGADVIVVGGGDGSVNTAAAALLDVGKPLGVLPLGTFNHFAKDLGIPLDLQQAVQTIADGHVRAVDVGEVNGHVFVNNSSIGLYPRAVEERDEQRKRFGWTKSSAMIYATVRVLRQFQVLRVTINVDGQFLQLTTPLVFVGNNLYEMRLFSVCGRSRLDGGCLSLYVAKTSGRFGLIRLGLHAMLGRLDQAREFESLAASELEITTRRPAVRVARDGEVRWMRPPLRYCIHPQALRVIVPADAA